MSVIIPHNQMLAEYILNMPMCIFCANPHQSQDCDVFPDSIQRIEILLRRSLCLVCLSHHSDLPCPRASVVCTMCKFLNHHVSVCYLQDEQQEDVVDVYESDLVDSEK